MRFEVSERIDSGCSLENVLNLTADQFRKISDKVEIKDASAIEAQGIELTFGSINRKDTTYITAKQIDGGWLLAAEISYRPSFVFWVLILITIWTYVGWVVPIAMFLYQKGTVKEAVITALQRVANELRQPSAPLQRADSLSGLERLAQLRERGILTDEEFQAKKAQILQS